MLETDDTVSRLRLVLADRDTAFSPLVSDEIRYLAG